MQQIGCIKRLATGDERDNGLGGCSWIARQSLTAMVQGHFCSLAGLSIDHSRDGRLDQTHLVMFVDVSAELREN